MARLEYRLLDPAREYPVLYVYDSIDKSEIGVRFACDRLVKAGTVYEKTSTAIELGTYVIYVQPDTQGRMVLPPEENGGKENADGVAVELRHSVDGFFNHKLIHVFRFWKQDDVLLQVQCDYLYWMGQEWLKLASELDEDRRIYSVYAQPVVEES